MERIKFILYILIHYGINLGFFLDFSLTIMVNRGWIPRSDRSTFKIGNKITDSIEIMGIIRATEKRPPFMPVNTPAKGVWYYRYKHIIYSFIYEQNFKKFVANYRKRCVLLYIKIQTCMFISET